MMIRQNIDKLTLEIEEICRKIGRNPAEVKLIAVSKTYPLADIKEAWAGGTIDFGENKVQELRDKAEVFSEGVAWHLIGHLQRKNAKYAVKYAEYIHSVDSAKLADEIQKRAESENKTQKILLEANTSGEESKFGLPKVEDVIALSEYVSGLANIKPVGLMTMAPYTDDESIIRRCFGKLREMKEKVNSKGLGLTELSMGMTNDYKIAIEEGATMLRIGTAIFGQRNYSNS
jgi:PLP dependent protein